jgi:hypothetical protein
MLESMPEVMLEIKPDEKASSPVDQIEAPKQPRTDS